MKRSLLMLLAGASLPLAFTPTAQAQDSGASAAGEGEIVVTARRRDELLQDVPQSVVAVTAANLENNNIFTFDDLDKVVAGLEIGREISTRGVTYNSQVGAFASAMGFYVNDAPFTAQMLNSAVYDVGQVEILRGPQGTQRGVAAPSGAITYSTRRPNLNEWTGSVSGTVGSLDNHNFQGGVSFPIIEDQLAVRLAGVLDQTDDNGVRSVNSTLEPEAEIRSGRISVLWEPVDNFSAFIVHQQIERERRTFGGALFGNGSPGTAGTVVGPLTYVAPANYNGPAIGQGAYLTATETRSASTESVEFTTAQLDYSFFNQRLSYVGAQTELRDGGYGGFGSNGPDEFDNANFLLNYSLFGQGPTTHRVDSHEIRISSEEPIGGLFDYVAGVFYLNNWVETARAGGGVTFLGGALGSPAGAVVTPTTVPNERYVLYQYVTAPGGVEEISYFGNVTFHIADAFEISAGLRHITSEADRNTVVTTGPRAGNDGAQVFNAATGLACLAPTAIPSATYGAGVCEIPIAPSSTSLLPGGVPYHVENDATIWDVSASWHITDNTMVYAHAGTSWREGPVAAGIQNAANNPMVAALIIQQPEESESYEIGLKWASSDGRSRFNLTYYEQDYENFFVRGPLTTGYYYSTAGGVAPPTVGTFQFTVNAPVEVRGVELDAAFAITDHWTISGNAAYVDSETSGAFPCRDSNNDGAPDNGTIPPTGGSFYADAAAFLAATGGVALCNLTGSPTTAPDWNANLQSEYYWTMGGGTELYVRGLYSYVPENSNADVLRQVPDLGLLDLSLGWRSEDRTWDISFYGKNVLDEQEIQSLGTSDIRAFDRNGALNNFGGSGYRTVTWSPRQEFGITARRTWGGG